MWSTPCFPRRERKLVLIRAPGEEGGKPLSIEEGVTEFDDGEELSMKHTHTYGVCVHVFLVSLRVFVCAEADVTHSVGASEQQMLP